MHARKREREALPLEGGKWGWRWKSQPLDDVLVLESHASFLLDLAFSEAWRPINVKETPFTLSFHSYFRCANRKKT